MHALRGRPENWELYAFTELSRKLGAILHLQFVNAILTLQFCDAVFNFLKQMQFCIFRKHFLPAICKPQCCKSNCKKTNSSSNSRNNYHKVNCASHFVSPSSSDYMPIAFSDAHCSFTFCFLIFSLESRINCFQYLSILDRRNETSSLVSFPA